MDCIFTHRFASDETLDGSASVVGPAVINDASHRSQYEIDVVAVSANGFTKEARSTAKKRGDVELISLERLYTGE